MEQTQRSAKAFKFGLRGGSANLTAANAGIEDLMLQSATHGTAKYDKDAFNEKLTGNIDKRQMGSISESHTFTANLLNTVHFGYSRVVSDAPTTLDPINAGLEFLRSA